MVSCSSTHEAHAVTYAVTVDGNTFIGQVIDHPQAATPTSLKVKSVDPGHDSKRRPTNGYWIS